eukprot:gnl/Spiro4/6598_TR3397_c0_g1_i1.p1 gnl/Spiro4/6598_TR3397_c0_g1~~gnl/Spiro4/6598_TR3397_c0_g1_i1.p1  ORF type:complete len:582 (-),score=92.27 gnl/Spiro4/6598_TR3397_c0_g1_i1:166-1725(-)
MIKRLAELSDAQSAHRLLLSAREQGILVEPPALIGLAEKLGRANPRLAYQHLFEAWQTGAVVRARRVYANIIAGFKANTHFRGATAIASSPSLSSEKFSPSSSVLPGASSVPSQDRWEFIGRTGARASACAAKKLEPSRTTLPHPDSPNSSSFDICLALAKHMEEVGLDPSRDDIVNIIAIASRDARPNQLDQLLQFLSGSAPMHRGPHAQEGAYFSVLELYNALVQSFARCGRMADAVALVNSMPTRGVSPDVITYNILIDCSTSLDQAFSFFNILKSTPGSAPDKASYASLLGVCRRELQLDAAHTVLREMNEAGLASPASYVNAIAAFSTQKEFEEAIRLFEEMTQKNLPPGLAGYTTMITTFARWATQRTSSQRIKDMCYTKALDLLSKMERDGHQIGQFAMNSVIGACGGPEAPSRISHAFELMKSRGLAPDHVTWIQTLCALLQNPKCSPQDVKPVLLQLAATARQPTALSPDISVEDLIAHCTPYLSRTLGANLRRWALKSAGRVPQSRQSS